MLYARRLGELSCQMSELEDLRDIVEAAERSARGAPPMRKLAHQTPHILRRRKPGALLPATEQACRGSLRP